MIKFIYCFALFLNILSCNAQIEDNPERKTFTFLASDDLEITADLYAPHPADSPFIILFHQAHWSRREYYEIAPRLNKLGFNCMAIDQRSGKEVLGVYNETFRKAKEKGFGTSYIDAEIDINSAIDFAKNKYPKAKIIIWGSSYSSALVLKIAGERNDISGVLSFAPGEYFEEYGKPKDYVARSAKKIEIPVFITSMRSEKVFWTDIYDKIPSKNKEFFVPQTEGQHGSRALWERFPEHENYWKAVEIFLSKLK